MKEPNIIFFVVDQLSAKWLEAASAGACPTPNIDALRAPGITVSNLTKASPLFSSGLQDQ